MSEYLGRVACPRCGDPEHAFEVKDWLTYLSVACAGCGYKMGELDTRSSPGTVSSVLSQRTARDAQREMSSMPAPHCRSHLEFRSDCEQCRTERQYG